MMETVANRIIEFIDGKAYDRRMTYDEYVDMMRAKALEEQQ